MLQIFAIFVAYKPHPAKGRIVRLFGGPLSSLSAYPLAIQFLGTALVLGIPFMCSGIVFARAFATAETS
jgi:hypothetical protein